MRLMDSTSGLGRIALGLCVGVVLNAQAQESGQISGSVHSESGNALGGAVVSIKSPQLMQPRKLVTDKNGGFRAPLLPPGDYTIDVSLNGYISRSAKGIRIGIGTKLRQEFLLKPIATAAASVEVVAVAAAQDKADTKTATNFSAEEINAIPAVSRAFSGAADLAPGVVAGQGGSYSIRGGKTQSTGYTLNGVAVKDDYEGRLTSTRVLEDAIEDIQVIQSPLNARFGRTDGGLVNVQTKSGGNDFSGSIRYALTRNDWNALSPYQTVNGSETSNDYYDRTYTITLNGPVVKDRLWFAVSTIQTPSVSSQSALTSGDDPVHVPYGDPVTGAPFAGYPGAAWDHGATISRVDSNDYFDAKLTFSLSTDHVFEYGYQQSKSTIKNRNPYGDGIIPTIGSNSLSQTQDDRYNTFGYRGTWAPNVFVEAHYARVTGKAVFPSPAYDHVRVNMVNSGSGNDLLFPYGFNTSPSPDIRDNQSGDVNFKVFLDGYGSHEIDAGVQFYEFERGTSTTCGPNNSRIYVGYATTNPWAAGASADYIPNLTKNGNDPYGNSIGFLTMDWNEAMNLGAMAASTYGWATTYRKYFGQDGTAKHRTSSAYVNDQWTVNKHIGVMVGLRLDSMKLYDTDGTVLRKYTPAPAPRIKVTYDFGGDGARVATFTAAKFYSDFSAGLTDAFIKKANSAYVGYGWSGDALGAVDYNSLNPGKNILDLLGVSDNTKAHLGWVNYDALVNPANYQSAFSFYNASKNNSGMDSLTAPYTYEYTLGYRRNFAEGHFVSVNVVHKEWKNDFAIVQDYTSDYAFFASSPDSKLSSVLPSMKTRYTNSDELKRRYNAVELEFLNVINSTWRLGGNYTYSRLTGNDNGGDSNSQAFRDNAMSAPLYLQGWLNGDWAAAEKSINKVPNDQLAKYSLSQTSYAADGPLINDATHKARLYLTATLPLGKGKITYSWLAKYDSGYAYSATQAIGAGGATFAAWLGQNVDARYKSWKGLNAATVSTFVDGRGSFRANDAYDMDFKLAFELPFFGKLALMGDLKITNLFNHQRQLTWSNSSSTSTVTKGTAYAVSSPSGYGLATAPDYYASARNVAATIGLKF